MRLLVSGSSGLVGSALARHWIARGGRVIRLVRGEARPGGDEIAWDPAAGRLDRTLLDAACTEGLDAVVHLSGASIAGARWNRARKALLWSSRVESTRLLAGALASAPRPPGVLITAGGIGYYGDRGEETLRETSPAGAGFLAGLCAAWEGASAPAAEAGIRVVPLRLGIVLSADGGALAKMLLPFRLGLGGRFGGGRHYMSWIDIEDLVRAVEHLIATEGLRGAVNAVAPHAVTNAEFTRTLASVLRRPALLPLPAVALRMLLGELGAELLASQRAIPARLLESGFAFRRPDLDGALRHALSRRAGG